MTENEKVSPEYFKQKKKVRDFWVTEMQFPSKKGTVPEELMSDLYHNTMYHPSMSVVYQLQKAIEKYPNERALYNYLSTVYIQLGKEDRADSVIEKTLELFPGYLFARLQWLERKMNQGDLTTVQQHLAPHYELPVFYQERTIFHHTEARSFYALVAKLALKLDYSDQFDWAMNTLLEFLEDDDDLITHLLREDQRSIFERMGAQLKKHKEISRSNKHFPTVEYEQKTAPPTFRLKQTELFYQTIDDDQPFGLEDISREDLAADVVEVLKDCLHRHEWYRESTKEFDLKGQSFPVHALRYAAYLGNQAALPVVFDMLRQGEAFLNYWFTDALLDFEHALYYLSKNDAKVLADFLKEPNLWELAASPAISALGQIAMQNEEKKEEVAALLLDLLQYMYDNKDNENIYNSETTIFIVSQCIDLQIVEALPLIKTLFEERLVSEMHSGKYEKIEKDILGDFEAWRFEPIPQNLEEAYTGEYRKRRAKMGEPHEITQKLDSRLGKLRRNALLNTFKENKESSIKHEASKRLKPAPKAPNPYANTGRNAPCPCGSGKKYKRCHGK